MRLATAIVTTLLLPAMVMAQNLFDGKPTDNAKLAKASAPGPQAAPNPHARAAAAINATAFQLLAGGTDLGTNGLIAPIGYHRADELAGALKKGGKQSDAMSLVNYLTNKNNDDSQSSRLDIASVIWAPGASDNRTITQRVEQQTGAEVYSLDLANRAQAVDDINAWISSGTDDAIRKPIDRSALGGAPAFVIGNSVDLRSAWASPFDPATTKEMPFTLSDGTKTAAMMMSVVANFGYLKTADIELALLPLGSDAADPAAPSLALAILLPPVGSDVAKLRASLTTDRFAGWMKSTNVSTATLEKWESTRPESEREDILEKWLAKYPMKAVTLSMPRFMLQTPPRPVSGWQFNAASGPGLFIQGAAIRVDEAGINLERNRPASGERASVGAIGEAVTLTADRPFLAAVVDRTSGVVILIGQVDKP